MLTFYEVFICKKIKLNQYILNRSTKFFYHIGKDTPEEFPLRNILITIAKKSKNQLRLSTFYA